MFSIATFFAIIHTQKNMITKNKNLPFVKTKNRNVLNVSIKNSWANAICLWEINHICTFVRLCFNENKKHDIKKHKNIKKLKKHKNKNIKKIFKT